MISIEEMNSFDQAASLKQEWDSIIDEAGLDISLSFDFITSLWESHLNKRDIVLLLAREDEVLIGIFPLTITKKMYCIGFPMTVVGPLSNLFCFHNNFICKPRADECFHAVIDYLNINYPKGFWITAHY